MTLYVITITGELPEEVHITIPAGLADVGAITALIEAQLEFSAKRFTAAQAIAGTLDDFRRFVRVNRAEIEFGVALEKFRADFSAAMGAKGE